MQRHKVKQKHKTIQKWNETDDFSFVRHYTKGCMNNITVGDNTWGYYETVSGGSGAGPNWHGTGGVHTVNIQKIVNRLTNEI